MRWLDDRSDNEAFNIANPKTYTVKELAQKIWRTGGGEGELKLENVPSFESDVKKRVPDVTKINTTFNWRSKVSLEEGLKKTIEWTTKDTQTFEKR